MVQVYGTTLKSLVHEKFGDGVISAINFRLDIKKVEDPEDGSRAVITLCVYKWFIGLGDCRNLRLAR
jgi:cyanate lyase